MAAPYDESDDELPPAYSELAPSPSSGGSRFPAELNLYYPSGAFFLGPNLSQPLYSVHVSYRHVIPLELEITLRTGPDSEFPAFGTLRISGSHVHLWAPKQVDVDLSQASVAQLGPTGLLGTGYGTYVFSVPVLSTGLVEEYVWKHSIVPDILQVSSGWTLSRKPSSEGEASGSGSAAGAAAGAATSSRGVSNETVATLSFKKDSRSKIGTIRFEGSGATGELGDRWAVVAILTALAIWQHKPRD
ncbi:hypothetical protein F5Y14DRAFT_406301 [Nemania sp. NC0429]|nr:hypothetical protein F5Y14DRAFT_406301 [Nemania sp. NC0429]